MSRRGTAYTARLHAAMGPMELPHPEHAPMPDAPGFQWRCLSELAYSKGHTVWQYADPALRLSAMLKKGFLNPASTKIATGDAVLAIAADRTVWLCARRFPISGVVLTWAR